MALFRGALANHTKRLPKNLWPGISINTPVITANEVISQHQHDGSCNLNFMLTISQSHEQVLVILLRAEKVFFFPKKKIRHKEFCQNSIEKGMSLF